MDRARTFVYIKITGETIINALRKPISGASFLRPPVYNVRISNKYLHTLCTHGIINYRSLEENEFVFSFFFSSVRDKRATAIQFPIRPTHIVFSGL